MVASCSYECSVLCVTCITVIIFLSFACMLRVDELPFCLRILLEQCVRKSNEFQVTLTAVCGIIHWQTNANTTVSFHPARVLFQDFT